MNMLGRGIPNLSRLPIKDQVRLEYIARYRRLRLVFYVTILILFFSALAIRRQVFLDHPAIAIAATAPLILLMLIAVVRITLYRCPYCEARLGWTPFFRTRCRYCNDLVDLRL